MKNKDARRCLGRSRYDTVNPDEREAVIAEDNRKKKETHTKRSKFKVIFEKYLNDGTQEEIVCSFIKILTDETVCVKDRCQVFELILKILGEDGVLTQHEMNDLSGVIKLEIA